MVLLVERVRVGWRGGEDGSADEEAVVVEFGDDCESGGSIEIAMAMSGNVIDSVTSSFHVHDRLCEVQVRWVEEREGSRLS